MAAENWISYQVSTRTLWTDVWAIQSNLICNKLTRAVNPTVDRAQLTWRTGDILQPGSATFADYTDLNLDGKFVLIEIPSLGIEWVGYVVRSNKDRWTQEIIGAAERLFGENIVYHAVGMEWFMDRSTVESSVRYDSAAVGTTARINRPIGYNVSMGLGRDVSYSFSGNKDIRLPAAGQAVFAEDSSHRTTWDAWEIAGNLLYYHFRASPATYFLDPADSVYLDWFKPVVQTEGRTLWNLLNQIIDRRRGLVWWLSYDSVGDAMDIKLSSTTSAAIAMPGGATLPAAKTITNYDFDNDITVARAVVRNDIAGKYDRIKVRGARRTSVFTVSTKDSTLQTSWSAATETAYKNGAIASAGYAGLTEAEKRIRNDRTRRNNVFERVYQAYTLPLTWNGKSSDGSGGGTFEYACPDMPQGSTSILGTEEFSAHGLRLLRTMPILAGYDYTDATAPVAAGPANTHPEYMQPFGIVKHDTGYVHLDRAAGDKDEDESDSKKLKTGYHLRMLKGEAGIEILAASGMPHAIAKNHFISTDPPSVTAPEVDYADMRVTVCGEWDAYCEAIWPVIADPGSDFEELVIYLGNKVRLDYLALGTVFDLADGQPKKVTTGGPIVDDRDICQQIAQIAHAWYGATRAALEVSLNNMQLPVDIGDYISNIGNNDTLEALNANVSQITHMPHTGKTTIVAGYEELDFGGLV